MPLRPSVVLMQDEGMPMTKKIIILFMMLFAFKPCLLGEDAANANDSAQSSAHRRIDITKIPSGSLIGSFFDVKEDPTGSLTMEQILEEGDLGFVPTKKDSPTFGFTPSAYWARLTLNNPTGQTATRYFQYNYPMADEVSVYYPVGKQYQSLKAGDQVKYSDRRVKDRFVVFDVDLEPGTSTLYFRVDSTGTVTFPINIWTPEAWRIQSSSDSKWAGLLLGAILVMIGYNLFLFVSFRTKVYFYYVLYLLVFSLHLVAAQGLSMGVIGENIDHHWLSNEGFLISAELSIMLMVLFAMEFLNIKTKMPKLLNLLWAHRVYQVSTILIVQFYSYELGAKLANIDVALSMLALMGLGFHFMWRGYRPAFFFSIAFLTILAANVVMAMKYSGRLPVNTFTTWAQLAGGAIEALLLSLALGDRVNYIRNIATQKIQTLNKKLENHIENVEAIVEEKTRDIKSIMTHLEQGVLTVELDKHGKDLIIGPDYSPYLEILLDEKNLAGKPVIPVLFGNATLSRDQISVIQGVIRACLGSSKICFNLNIKNLVQEYIYIFNSDLDEHIFEVDWSPVIKSGTQDVEKILITIRDVTKIRELQYQAKINQEELEIVGEILGVESERFSWFIDSSYKMIEENKRLIKMSSSWDMEVIKIMFINTHTMKGSARSLKFKSLTEELHQIEQSYSELQKNPETCWDKPKLLRQIDQVMVRFNNYNEINLEKLGRGSAQNRVFLEKANLERKLRLFDKVNLGQLSSSDRKVINEIKEDLVQLLFRDSRTLFNEIFKSAPTIAKDLGKQSPKIHVEDTKYEFSEDICQMLKDIFIHIIRNSLDHGIEDAEIRTKQGKDIVGNLYLSYQETPEGLTIQYHDDGQGLNIKRLEQLAKKSRILNADECKNIKSLSEIIFVDGISTALTVSEISGRGIGMAAVKQYTGLRNSECHIELGVPESETSDFIPFKLHIKLTENHFRRNIINIEAA